MKLTPILTEKTLNDAKNSKFTFWVDPSLTKHKIKNLIEDIFSVSVLNVKTINYKKRIKKNYRGRKATTMPRKKAVVTLSQKDKIDIFDTKTK